MKEEYQLNKLIKGLTSFAVSITVFAACFIFPFSAHAAEMDVKVQVNDDLIQFPDAQPFLDTNHSTQVPIRFVTEKLGYALQWEKDGNEIKVTLNNNKHTITLTIRAKRSTD